MTTSTAFLAALQLADSALPIGRFVHSHGLEAWLSANPGADEDALAACVESMVVEAIAPLDGAALLHAHRATTVADLLDIDRRVTARKLIEPARSASQACGRQLARLAPTLTDDRLIAALAGSVRARETDGNLAVMHGALTRALEIPVHDALLLELSAAAAGLLSSAVRLGRLTAMRSQRVLRRMAPALTLAADRAATLPLDGMRSTAPELEIAALAHRRASERFFST